MNNDLISSVSALARQAGERLMQRFSPESRIADVAQLAAALAHNDDAALAGVREALRALRPEAGWVDEALEKQPLSAGEWWVVDAVEGNVNHVHGMDDWAVSITLVRDGSPVLAVVRQPVADLTYTAEQGAGAFVNGVRLRASQKQSLTAAVVATGQAEAGQTETYARIGASITAMLGHTLVVRAMVPSTFPMLLVARGQHDVFWQYSPVLPGVAAGVLFVREAGGSVSRIDGSAWAAGSGDILVAAPGLHAAAVNVLGGMR